MASYFRYFIALFMAIVFISGLLSPDADAARKRSKKRQPFKVSAKSAVLLEAGHLRSLYDKNGERKVLPASTTKVMTAIIVLERLKLDNYVTVSERATQALPSKIELRAGERYRVRDLLYAALLNSANDASIALAEAVSGSEVAFVTMMNQKAKQLGAKNTLFANCHGLPSEDSQHTTAYDMALIFNYAMQNSFFKEAIQNRFWSIQSEAGRKISLRSHNQALFKGWKEDIYGKTGYTNAAQACFVGQIKTKKEPLIIAVFGCSRRWDDVKFIVEKYGGIDL